MWEPALELSIGSYLILINFNHNTTTRIQGEGKEENDFGRVFTDVFHFIVAIPDI